MKPWLWLYSEGYSYAEIAFQFEVSADTVRNFILESGTEPLSRPKAARVMHLKRKIKEVITGKAFKVTPGRRPKKLSLKQEEEIILIYLQKLVKVKELTKAYGISRQFLYKILDKHGVRYQKKSAGLRTVIQDAEKLKKDLIFSLHDFGYSFNVLSEVFGIPKQSICRMYYEIIEEKKRPEKNGR